MSHREENMKKGNISTKFAIGVTAALITATAIVGYLENDKIIDNDYEYVQIENSGAEEESMDKHALGEVDVNELKEYIANKNDTKDKTEIRFTECASGVEVLKPGAEKENVEVEQYKEEKLPEYDNLQDDEYEKGKIVVSGAKGALRESTYDKFYEYLSQVEDKGGKISFMMLDPETGASVSYNANELMNPCCTIKAGVALAVADAIDRGEITWDDKLTFQSWNRTGGSSFIQKYYNPGDKLTVYNTLFPMLKYSCNNGLYMIEDLLGDKYNQMLEDLGCDNTNHEKYQFSPTSASDIAKIWETIYEKGHEEGLKLKEAREKGEKIDVNAYSPYAVVYDTLAQALYSDLEVYFSEYPSIHKSGWSTGRSNARNDAGIVYTKYGDLVVVIMTEPYAKPDPQLGKLIENCMEDYFAIKPVIIMEQDEKDNQNHEDVVLHMLKNEYSKPNYNVITEQSKHNISAKLNDSFGPIKELEYEIV